MDAQTRDVKTWALCPEKHSLIVEVLRRGHAFRLQVLGASMLPSIWPRDVLKVERKDCSQILAGDVVLVRQEDRFFVHRVVGKASHCGSIQLITRGDCMPQDDPPVSSHEVLGAISGIYRQGGVHILGNRVSPLEKLVGRLLCHCTWLRNLVLGIHGRYRNALNSRYR
jgi:signal peptidase I